MAYLIPWLSNNKPSFTFAWNANAAGDNVTSYKFYSGKSSGSYGAPVNVGNVTTYTVANPGGQNNYYALTAVNANGESGFSTEVGPV
jgi:hypothetical protein